MYAMRSYPIHATRKPSASQRTHEWFCQLSSKNAREELKVLATPSSLLLHLGATLSI